MRASFLAAVLLSLAASAAFAANIDTWQSSTARLCPSRHLDWICDGCWDDFLADFESTLPRTTRKRITRIADYAHRCEKEVAGFSCEMSVHVDAMDRLGLLKRFVSWGCAHYSCEDLAVCTREGPASGKH
jgi:hypothetical protein